MKLAFDADNVYTDPWRKIDQMQRQHRQEIAALTAAIDLMLREVRSFCDTCDRPRPETVGKLLTTCQLARAETRELREMFAKLEAAYKVAIK